MWTSLFQKIRKTTPGPSQLSELEDRAEAELTPRDFIENIVIKIADEVEVDVSTRVWTVSFADAIVTALKITIEGVEVPYLDLQTLIRSKSTSENRTKWTFNDCVR